MLLQVVVFLLVDKSSKSISFSSNTCETNVEVELKINNHQPLSLNLHIPNNFFFSNFSLPLHISTHTLFFFLLRPLHTKKNKHTQELGRIVLTSRNPHQLELHFTHLVHTDIGYYYFLFLLLLLSF